MFKRLAAACGLFLIASTAHADNPRVLLTTSLGEIEMELYEDKAPVTVANFLRYVEAGHYDNLIFHRVIPGFMIQGGGFDANMRQRSVGKPIKNEADNGLKNERYTVAMARTNDPDSATAQFFINHSNNDFLNRNASSAGYAVFGKVTEGQHVVETIAKVPTGNQGMHQNVPQNPVTIINAKRVDSEAE